LKNPDKDPTIVRIYSWRGIRAGDSLKFSTVAVSGNSKLEYENGDEIKFEDGVVTYRKERFPHLSGNYIASDKGVTSGFIRNFD
jgi:hypothetical protein